jgi:hypothetical protein
MASESDTTSEESAEGGVHRLRDIVVEEVSLVDRAANKRRFIVVKRSDVMTDTQTDGSARAGAKKKPTKTPPVARRRAHSVSGSEGAEGTTRRPPSAEDEEDDEEDDEIDKADDEEEDEDEEDEDVETDKADEEEDDEEEADEDEEDEDVEADKADDEDEDDEEEADEDVETDKADEDDDDGDEEDEETIKSTDDADGDSGRASARRGNASKTETPALALSPAMKQALLPPITQALERLLGIAKRVNRTNASDRDDIAAELGQVGGLLDGIAKQLPAAHTNADVAKAGARMARGRLDRFQKALATLSELLKELTAAGKRPALTANAKPSREVRQKTAAVPGLGALVVSVSELTKAVQRQQAEIVGLRKTRATSNAIPVEGERRTAKQDVSWPLDMNRPITRDTVGKSVSFYED